MTNAIFNVSNIWLCILVFLLLRNMFFSSELSGFDSECSFAVNHLHVLKF